MHTYIHHTWARVPDFMLLQNRALCVCAMCVYTVQISSQGKRQPWQEIKMRCDMRPSVRPASAAAASYFKSMFVPREGWQFDHYLLLLHMHGY